MKGNEGLIPEQPRPPEVKILEGKTKTRERQFSSISDSSVRSPEEVSRADHNTDFELAYSSIVGNRDLERLVIKGFLSKGNVLPFAELMNKITELCVTLRDDEIDSIVRKFKESLRKHSLEYAAEFELTGKQLENIQTGMWNDKSPQAALNPEGIKAVARFVRARKKLHAISPQTFPAFYFENYLDAQHKIDLIETIDSENGIIINLIQIKSYDYGPGDIDRNTQSHKDWANEFTVDVDSYESNFISKPKDSLEYEAVFKKPEIITSILLDAMLGDVMPDKNILFNKLGINRLSKAEQIWILENYLPGVKEDLKDVVILAELGDERAQRMNDIVSELEAQLEKSHAYKKDLSGVSEIHSLCTVNEKVVSDVIIFKENNPQKRKAIKIKK